MFQSWGGCCEQTQVQLHTDGIEEALVVRTHAQARRDELEEDQQFARKKDSGVQHKLLGDNTDGDAVVETKKAVEEGEVEETELLGSTFAEELFLEDRQAKLWQNRKLKRLERSKHRQVRGKDRDREKRQTESL